MRHTSFAIRLATGVVSSLGKLACPFSIQLSSVLSHHFVCIFFQFPLSYFVFLLHQAQHNISIDKILTQTLTVDINTQKACMYKDYK